MRKGKQRKTKEKPAKGAVGYLMTPAYDDKNKLIFRVYDKRKDGKELTFTDYEVQSTDIKVKILDKSQVLKNSTMYGPELDWNKETLGE